MTCQRVGPDEAQVLVPDPAPDRPGAPASASSGQAATKVRTGDGGSGGAVVERLAARGGALAQRGDGPSRGPGGPSGCAAPRPGPPPSRPSRGRRRRRAAARRAPCRSAPRARLEPLGHVRHGLARAAHLGSGVLCTS